MALIKGTQAGDLVQEAIVLDLGDLRRQADRILSEARAEAAQIHAQARQEAEALAAGAAEKGYAEGYERGHAEGTQAGQEAGHAQATQQVAQQAAQLQEAWIQALGQWEAQRTQMLVEARQLLLELALAMARKVVRRVPDVDPSIVIDQVAAALDYVTRPGSMTIRIHPEDRPLIEQALPTLMQNLGGAQHASLVEDPQIRRGGCAISSGQGRIDATIDRQLRRMVEAMFPGAEPADEPAEIAPDQPVDEPDAQDPENPA